MRTQLRQRHELIRERRRTEAESNHCVVRQMGPSRPCDDQGGWGLRPTSSRAFLSLLRSLDQPHHLARGLLGRDAKGTTVPIELHQIQSPSLDLDSTHERPHAPEFPRKFPLR